MDMEQGELQFSGFFGICKESFKIINIWMKIFTQISLVAISDNTKLARMLMFGWATLWLLKSAHQTIILICSLLPTLAVVYTIAYIYSAKEVTFMKVLRVAPKVWKLLCSTKLFHSRYGSWVLPQLSTEIPRHLFQVLHIVFYFVCKSQCQEQIDMSAFWAHLEAYVEDYLPLEGREKEREIRSKQFQICIFPPLAMSERWAIPSSSGSPIPQKLTSFPYAWGCKPPYGQLDPAPLGRDIQGFVSLPSSNDIVERSCLFVTRGILHVDWFVKLPLCFYLFLVTPAQVLFLPHSHHDNITHVEHDETAILAAL
ncbi:hypothetical protein CK203_063566 [Vitis vinifera]|uniref:Uncharacterized protein n=1 Tax=Vitis vinifera TaxID=29760 RepID=A0A438GC66_VITVI|nr:hypothetical protein CK203_063566 [Vitis vinifera]